MADDYLTAEASVESSAPREFYEIVQSAAVTYRIASGTRDIIYNGQTFTASPLARTELYASQADQSNIQIAIALPLSHPLVARYMARGSPPRQVLVTIFRRQQGIGDERAFGGQVVSIAIQGHLAKLAIVPRLARLMQRKLPVFTADTICPHILYDQNCRVPRASYTITTIATFFDGRRVQVATAGTNPDRWFQFGEFVHVATGERMTIVDHKGLMMTLQAPIPDLIDGDAVAISAGCAHDIGTCYTKFANQVNFGGFPQLPTTNPFIPTGDGVMDQEK